MIHVTIKTFINNQSRRPQYFTALTRTAALETINKNIRDLTHSYMNIVGFGLDTTNTSDDGNIITLDLKPALTLYKPARVIYELKEA